MYGMNCVVTLRKKVKATQKRLRRDGTCANNALSMGAVMVYMHTYIHYVCIHIANIHIVYVYMYLNVYIYIEREICTYIRTLIWLH